MFDFLVRLSIVPCEAKQVFQAQVGSKTSELQDLAIRLPLSSHGVFYRPLIAKKRNLQAWPLLAGFFLLVVRRVKV